MGNWFVKSFDNYFKFIDDDSSMIVLTSASIRWKWKSIWKLHIIIYRRVYLNMKVLEILLYHHLILHHHIQVHREPVPQIISESLWEEKKEELKSYIINSL